RMGLAEGRVLVISTNKYLANNKSLRGLWSNQECGLQADKTCMLVPTKAPLWGADFKAPPFGWGSLLTLKLLPCRVFDTDAATVGAPMPSGEHLDIPIFLC
ncbi:MAG TPA: hypothetical protein DCZ69_12150, partial [Syntrophobacteraceae bacterium]|nr:hypothetical protein [Syntrophobacteraceae bacterium]